MRFGLSEIDHSSRAAVAGSDDQRCNRSAHESQSNNDSAMSHRPTEAGLLRG